MFRRKTHHPDAGRQTDKQTDGPHSRAAKHIGREETPDQLAEHRSFDEDRGEARLDEGVEESFPASDPVSAHHIT